MKKIIETIRYLDLKYRKINCIACFSHLKENNESICDEYFTPDNEESSGDSGSLTKLREHCQYLLRYCSKSTNIFVINYDNYGKI